jgi:hypothetical protein
MFPSDDRGSRLAHGEIPGRSQPSLHIRGSLQICIVSASGARLIPATGYGGSARSAISAEGQKHTECPNPRRRSGHGVPIILMIRTITHGSSLR